MLRFWVIWILTVLGAVVVMAGLYWGWQTIEMYTGGSR